MASRILQTFLVAFRSDCETQLRRPLGRAGCIARGYIAPGYIAPGCLARTWLLPGALALLMPLISSCTLWRAFDPELLPRGPMRISHFEEHARATGRMRHRIVNTRVESRPGVVVVEGQLATHHEFQQWLLLRGQKEYVREVESLFTSSPIERDVWVTYPAQVSGLDDSLSREDIEALPADIADRLQQPVTRFWAEAEHRDQALRSSSAVEIAWHLFDVERAATTANNTANNNTANNSAAATQGVTVGFGRVYPAADGEFRVDLSLPFVEAILRSTRAAPELHLEVDGETLVVPMTRESFQAAQRDLHG